MIYFETEKEILKIVESHDGLLRIKFEQTLAKMNPSFHFLVFGVFVEGQKCCVLVAAKAVFEILLAVLYFCRK